MFESLVLPVALILLITSLVLVTVNDWRLSLLALAVQYVGVFSLVAIHLPLMIALTKLVAGWISVVVLGMALSTSAGASSQEPSAPSTPQGGWKNLTSVLSAWIFRLLAAAMVVLVVLTMAPLASEWISGVRFELVAGALILMGLGLLHLGLTAVPYRIILALLTVLSGFEIVYAMVETSTLVAGLLAGVNLGLATIGAYLLVTAAGEVEA